MKRTFQISLSKIGKDRFAILFLAGLLLMLIAVPEKTVEQAVTGQAASVMGSGVAGTRTVRSGNERSGEVAHEENGGEINSADAYCRSLERRLEEVLSCMDHAGKVKVFVSVNETFAKVVEKDIPGERKNVYETGKDGENKNTAELSEKTQTVYTEDELGHKIPFVAKQVSPAVRGVVVVAQGGGNEVVKRQIIEVIEALFSIDAHKIKVVKMREQ